MKIFRFNMIEIVLAIGIAAFGIMGVVAMIPPAINANRDVAADAFVDEAVSKIGAYVTLVLMYQASWTETCPNSKPSDEDAVISSRPSGSEVINGFNMWHKANGIYWMEASDGTPFAVRLWCKKNSDDSVQIKDFYNGESTGQTLSQGVRIFAEIAWPPNRAADKRENRTFCWDVFKQE